jgi:hypothetical protein
MREVQGQRVTIPFLLGPRMISPKREREVEELEWKPREKTPETQNAERNPSRRFA